MTNKENIFLIIYYYDFISNLSQSTFHSNIIKEVKRNMDYLFATIDIFLDNYEDEKKLIEFWYNCNEFVYKFPIQLKEKLINKCPQDINMSLLTKDLYEYIPLLLKNGRNPIEDCNKNGFNIIKLLSDQKEEKWIKYIFDYKSNY